MRIALVCPYSLSVPGGVQGQVLGLAAAFGRQGHEAVVVAPCDGPGPEGDGIVAVGRSLRFRVNGSTAPMAPLPGPAVRTVRALRRGGFDVVHLHEPVAASITLAALAGGIGRFAPTVGTFHAAGDQTPYRWAGRLLKPVAARLDRRVAVSEAARRLAQHHLGGTYDVLFNGIDATAFSARATDGAAAAVDRPTILFLGRHEPRKGLEVLLEAMAQLPDEVALWVAGEGPATAALRRRWAHDRRISWLGPLDEADKVARLRKASVVCVPSLHGESFGVTLLEAMAAGTPVVASDLPGYRPLAAGGAALLTPPGRPEPLAATLRAVLTDPAVAARLRHLGCLQAQHYSIDHLARRYLAIYEALARASV